MDISVRDPRADRSPQNPQGTGWVFGTFVYNGKVNNPNKFMNLVPVGLMWGNDPDNKVNKTNPFPPMKTMVNKDLKETVIFESKMLPPQHLGWNGRLNGPADLNTVSCLSCHNTAQYPQATSLVPDSSVPDGGLLPPAKGGTDGMDEVVPEYRVRLPRWIQTPTRQIFPSRWPSPCRTFSM